MKNLKFYYVVLLMFALALDEGSVRAAEDKGRNIDRDAGG